MGLWSKSNAQGLGEMVWDTLKKKKHVFWSIWAEPLSADSKGSPGCKPT